MAQAYHCESRLSPPLKKDIAQNMALKLAEMTLDELKPVLAAALPHDAAFDGWNARALGVTADRLGIDPKIAALAFPGGAMEMIDAWFATIDVAMLTRLPPEQLGAMKIRQRITALVEARLTILAPHREALRRAQAVLAVPTNGPRAVKLGWRAADAMWHAAGDTATDYNHYTKRAILGSVYGATLLVFVNDESDDWAETRAFLGRRIEGIMKFEKAKAQLTSKSDYQFSMARLFGRLRYPNS
jgi:ubiquinone biosynthesis protein COQ9